MVMQFVYNFWQHRNYLLYLQSHTELTDLVLNEFITYLGDNIRYDFIQQTDTPEYYNRHNKCYNYTFYGYNNLTNILKVSSATILYKDFLDRLKQLLDNCCGYGFDTNNIDIKDLTVLNNLTN